MARPLRVQFPDALYHVTNRGNERKAIFKDDNDRREFLKILSQSIDTYGVIIHAFVLMNNHWHLLAQTPLANLGEFMRHFNMQEGVKSALGFFCDFNHKIMHRVNR